MYVHEENLNGLFFLGVRVGLSFSYKQKHMANYYAQRHYVAYCSSDITVGIMVVKAYSPKKNKGMCIFG